MKCSACAIEIPDDSTFCPKCGAKIGAAPVASQPVAGLGVSLGRGKAPEEPEQKLWSGNYSGKEMIVSWLFGLIVSIALIVGSVVFPVASIPFLAIIVLIWLALAAILLYRKFSIHYELTTQRFIHHSGILTRTSDRIEIIDIDDVAFTQNIVQRMFNVGTVRVSSSDRTHPMISLIGITDVKRVADLIDDARRRERRRRGLHIESI